MDIFNLSKKKIFVIGGSGLIGVEICKLLRHLGAIVYNLDITNSVELKGDINYLKFDISKDNLIEKKNYLLFQNLRNSTLHDKLFLSGKKIMVFF